MPNPSTGRRNNREVENEQVRPQPSGDGPPRPATEPPGSKRSSQHPDLETDPGTGEQKS